MSGCYSQLKYHRLTFAILIAFLLLLYLPQVKLYAAEPQYTVRQVLAPDLTGYDGIQISNNLIIAYVNQGLDDPYATPAPGERKTVIMDYEGNILFTTEEFDISLFEPVPYLLASYVEVDEDNPLKKTTRIGTISPRGEILVPLEYDMLSPITDEGYSMLQKQVSPASMDPVTGVFTMPVSKIGFADASGKITFEPQFDANYPVDNERALVSCDGKWSLVTYAGDLLQTFSEEFTLVRTATFPKFDPEIPVLRAIKNNLWGMMNWDENVILPFEYEAIKTFSEGLCWVKKDGLWGLVDTAGKVVLEPTYELRGMMDRAQLDGDFSGGCAIIVDAENRWGMVDLSGKLVVEFGAYEDIPSTYDYRPVNVKVDGLWGAIDATGSYVFEPQFKYLLPFNSGFGFGYDGDKWLFLSVDGEVITELPMDATQQIRINPVTGDEILSISVLFNNEIAVIPMGDTKGIINRSGDLLLEGLVNFVSSVELYPMFTVQKDGVWSIWEVVKLDAGETNDSDQVSHTDKAAPYVISITDGAVTHHDEKLPEMPIIPEIVNDRTMLPFRYLIETIFGGTVDFQEATNTISANISDIEYILIIDQADIHISGEMYNFGVAPYRSGDTLMVPLRAFEASVSKLEWDEMTQMVSIIP